MIVTVDVVDLRRIERLHARDGEALERRLLHPDERRAGAGTRALAAALATKEAWLKAHPGPARPDGWTFDSVAFVPRRGVPALARRLAADLGLDAVESGAVAGRPAAHGVHDRWLVAAVLA